MQYFSCRTLKVETTKETKPQREANIMAHLTKVGYDDMDWIQPTMDGAEQRACVNTLVGPRVS